MQDAIRRDVDTPPPLGLSPAEISSILVLIPAVGLDYAEWFKVGAALHNEGVALAPVSSQ